MVNSQTQQLSKIFSQLKEKIVCTKMFLCGQLASPALYFDFPDVCWEYAAEREQSQRFLEHVEDNFLAQMVKKSTREDVLLDLLLINRERLVSDTTIRSHLGLSDHKTGSKEGGEGC